MDEAMHNITHAATQWTRLCTELGLDPFKAHVEDVYRALQIGRVPPGWRGLLVTYDPSADADALVAQLLGIISGKDETA